MSKASEASKRGKEKKARAGGGAGATASAGAGFSAGAGAGAGAGGRYEFAGAGASAGARADAGGAASRRVDELVTRTSINYSRESGSLELVKINNEKQGLVCYEDIIDIEDGPRYIEHIRLLRKTINELQDNKDQKLIKIGLYLKEYSNTILDVFIDTNTLAIRGYQKIYIDAKGQKTFDSPIYSSDITSIDYSTAQTSSLESKLKSLYTSFLSQEKNNSLIDLLSLYLSESIKFQPVLTEISNSLSSKTVFDLDRVVTHHHQDIGQQFLCCFNKETREMEPVTYRKMVSSWQDIGSSDLKLFYFDNSSEEQYVNNKHILEMPMIEAKFDFQTTSSASTPIILDVEEKRSLSAKIDSANRDLSKRPLAKAPLPKKTSPVPKHISYFVKERSLPWMDIAFKKFSYNPLEKFRSKEGQFLHTMIFAYSKSQRMSCFPYPGTVIPDDIRDFINKYPKAAREVSANDFTHLNDVIKFSFSTGLSFHKDKMIEVCSILFNNLPLRFKKEAINSLVHNYHTKKKGDTIRKEDIKHHLEVPDSNKHALLEWIRNKDHFIKKEEQRIEEAYSKLEEIATDSLRLNKKSLRGQAEEKDAHLYTRDLVDAARALAKIEIESRKLDTDIATLTDLKIQNAYILVQEKSQLENLNKELKSERKKPHNDIKVKEANDKVLTSQEKIRTYTNALRNDLVNDIRDFGFGVKESIDRASGYNAHITLVDPEAPAGAMAPSAAVVSDPAPAGAGAPASAAPVDADLSEAAVDAARGLVSLVVIDAATTGATAPEAGVGTPASEPSPGHDVPARAADAGRALMRSGAAVSKESSPDSTPYSHGANKTDLASKKTRRRARK